MFLNERDSKHAKEYKEYKEYKEWPGETSPEMNWEHDGFDFPV